jgi:hypothetical protein
MSEDIDHVILNNCQQRLLARDPDAGFDLAQLILGDLPNNDVSVLIALIEGLIHQSGQLRTLRQTHCEPKQQRRNIQPLPRSVC